jgi:hypothetical protein
MFVTCCIENPEAMKKLILLLIFLIFLICDIFAGTRVEGAKISLIKSDNKEVWAMTHTGVDGEFLFHQIQPGSYILSINIPLSSFTVDNKEKEKLKKLVEGGCDKENGRMVFTLNDNCFIFDINCEEQTNNKFKPHFTVLKQENDYLVTIAIAEITEPFDLKGIFQSLTVQFYKKCLEGGKFKLQQDMSTE